MQMYTAKTYQFPELKDISGKQLEAHIGLYNGYVKNTNLLLEKIPAARTAADEPALSELTRRFAFEFNGMRLHEFYFDQFLPAVGDVDSLKAALAAQYGSFEAWQADFVRIGKMRGIGWVLLVADDNGNLLNIWVSDHEYGHLGGLKVIMAMDVWEHAYLVDFMPSQRPDYIAAFMANVQWEVVAARLAA